MESSCKGCCQIYTSKDPKVIEVPNLIKSKVLGLSASMTLADRSDGRKRLSLVEKTNGHYLIITERRFLGIPLSRQIQSYDNKLGAYGAYIKRCAEMPGGCCETIT